MRLSVVLVRRKPPGCWEGEEFVVMPRADSFFLSLRFWAWATPPAAERLGQTALRKSRGRGGPSREENRLLRRTGDWQVLSRGRGLAGQRPTAAKARGQGREYFQASCWEQWLRLSASVYWVPTVYTEQQQQQRRTWKTGADCILWHPCLWTGAGWQHISSAPSPLPEEWATGHHAHGKGVYVSSSFSGPQVHASPICVVLTWFPESTNQHALCALPGGHTKRPRLDDRPAGMFSTYLKETCAFESPLRTQVWWVEVVRAPNFGEQEAAVCSLTSSSHPQVIPVLAHPGWGGENI